MHTVELAFVKPNATLFPKWQPAIGPAMDQEMRVFLAPILGGVAPAQDLLTSRYTFVYRGLAQFYALPGADQLPVDAFPRVMLSDDRRGGVLRQGSMLALTSRPDRGSPTRRGKWILERLLCDPPPAPPANVPALDPNVPFNGTLRQRLQMVHQKAGPACA